MLTTLANYQLIANNLDASLKRVAQRPEVAREVDYYLSRIGDIKSIDDFMADERVYRFALEASGLGDMVYARAFIRKVLEEGVENPDSLANKLADGRFREFARRFNFASFGSAATTFERTRQQVVDDYVRLKLEKEAGEQDEGVRLALYFRRRAAGIRNGYDILADRALMKVAETVIGFPLAYGDIDRNARLIEEKLDLESLKDPAAVEKFLTRFATMWQMQAGPGGTGAAPLSSGGILFPQPLEAGIGADVLASLQKIKLGGF
ncbi:MAG TPA: DUF1217 domain-containing protein [Thermopetrobacter sp.]|nr:DUF1217 domain-containing protein [Thermopetrobacter sp.]